MTTSDEVLAALKRQGSFDVVNHTVGAGQLRLLGRVPLKGPQAKRWLDLVDHLLGVCEEAPWKVDISKNYFRRDGELRFGWRLIFQTPSLEQHLGDIAAAIERAFVVGAPLPRNRELTEFPLAGVGPDRNMPIAGKRGAGSVGSVPIGPMAMQNKMMGGGA